MSDTKVNDKNIDEMIDDIYRDITSFYDDMNNDDLYKKILSSCGEIISMDSECSEPYIMMGEILNTRKDPTAENYYRKALEIEPDEPEYNGSFADFLIGDERHGEAKIFVEKAISLGPDDPDNYARMAEIQMKEGKYEDALDNIELAISMGSSYESDFLIRATVNFNLGKYEDTLENLDEIIGMGYGNANVHFWKSQVLYQMGRYDDSADSFDTAINMDTTYVLAELSGDIKFMSRN